jgi:hypothetical protein
MHQRGMLVQCWQWELVVQLSELLPVPPWQCFIFLQHITWLSLVLFARFVNFAAVFCYMQSAQREGASTTRLFRSLWIYTAMHKLVTPSAGTTAAAGAAAAAAGDVQWEWQLAAGRLAAVTPLLMVGTNSNFEADMVERLKVGVQSIAKHIAAQPQIIAVCLGACCCRQDSATCLQPPST